MQQNFLGVWVMMLKKDKNIRKLEHLCSELELDLKAIRDEYSFYKMNVSDEDAVNWFNCLPIETLKESIDREKFRPRLKYSLKDMHNNFRLKELHSKKEEELSDALSNLRVAKINSLISYIKSI